MEKESRRVQMTRRMLYDAMVEILREKPPEKLTVTEICQHADVNRTTYYKYYTDPLDQYTQTANATIAGLTKIVRDSGMDLKKLLIKKEMRRFVVQILDYVEENLLMIQAMDKYSALDFWVDLSYRLGAAFLPEGDEKKRDYPEDLTEMGAFAFTGAYALIFRWVNTGEPKSKEDLADSIVKYVRAVLKARFKVLSN